MALDIVGVYAIPEVTFGVEPAAAADGTGYLPGSIVGNPLPSDDFTIEETNFSIARNRMTAGIPGVDGGSVAMDAPMVGLSEEASDGESPVAQDFLDTVVSSAFGAATDLAGEGLATGGTTSSVVTDTDVRAIEDMLIVRQATRSEIRAITSETGAGPTTYGVTPALSVAPDAALDTFGYRYWSPAVNSEGGPSYSMYMPIGQAAPTGPGYRLSGCATSSLKLTLEGGKPGMINFGVRADSYTRNISKAGIPALATLSTPTIIGQLGQSFWGTTAFGLGKVEIDWRLVLSPITDWTTANGRSRFIVTSAIPRITVNPLASLQYEADFRAGTVRSLLMQFGSGLFANARINMMFFFAQAVQIKSNKLVQDGRVLRNQIVMDVVDAGIRTGTTPYRHWLFGRG